MLEIIMVLFTVYTLLKVYIAVMQIGYIAQEKNKEALLMSEEKYKIAGEYAIKKQRIDIVSTLVDYAMFVCWVTVGFAWLTHTLNIENTAVDAVLFLFGFAVVGFVVGLPFDLYQTFKLDKAYGFTKTTPKLYLLDQIKGAGMFFVLGGAIFYALAWIVIHIDNWWIWGFALIFTIILIMQIIYPIFIVPIFNKLTLLEEGELSRDIESMMSDVGLKNDGVFVMDASKRDTRLNAFFAGLGKAKRVVLFDTLMEKLNNKELLAVLGHELGHYSHGDIWKGLGMMATLFFSAFYLLGNLPEKLFFEMGIEPHAGAEIAMMMLLLALLGFVFTPIMSFVSRHNEYAADEFGSKLGGKENLVSALMKLIEENKSFPKSHPLFAFFYYTHPPVIERLKELGYDATAVNEMAKPLEKDGIFGFLDDEKKQ